MSTLLHSYLVAWLFVLGLSLGALANLMIHALTGGRWAGPVRPAWIAAARLMPVVAFLFIPILLGSAYIYPWTAQPGRWLNTPFFIARSIAYLAIWVGLAWAYLRADRRTAALSSGNGVAAQRVSAAGLVIYTFTVSLAAVDWIGSLTPEWRSSGFGLGVAVGQLLSGAAFGTAAAAIASRERRDDATRALFHDLGNLLLMYVLMWAYLAYTQLLIIWSENLPREIQWYVPRLQTGWAALGVFLVAFHFFLPLLILLSRSAKRSPRWLGAIAASLLAAHLADVFWLVMPSVRPAGFAIAWTDAAAIAALGALWLGLWRRAMSRPQADSIRAEAVRG
jgi:hypothetical protein